MTETHVVESAGAGDFEPFIHQGQPTGEIKVLAVGDASSQTLDAGVWRSGPATYDYFFEEDETFVVLEGAATIQLQATNETVEVVQGDVGYFVAGTRSVWIIRKSFKKFVVVAKPAQAERDRIAGLLAGLAGMPFEEREAAIAGLPHDDRAAVLNAEAEAEDEVLPEDEELGGEG